MFKVDGYVLKYENRKFWWVNMYYKGKLIDKIHVAFDSTHWTDKRTPIPRKQYSIIYYQKQSEMEARLQDPLPFRFGLAKAKNYEIKPPYSVKEFQAIYMCKITGRVVEGGVEVEHLRRLIAEKEEAS